MTNHKFLKTPAELLALAGHITFKLHLDRNYLLLVTPYNQYDYFHPLMIARGSHVTTVETASFE